MTLQEELGCLMQGQSLVTMKSQAAVYKAAEKAGVQVKTEKTGEGLFVTVTGTITRGLPPLAEQVERLKNEERVALFAPYCRMCGFKKGSCHCPDEGQVETPKPREDVQERGITEPPKPSIEYCADCGERKLACSCWKFPSPQHRRGQIEWHDNGNAYRQQYRSVGADQWEWRKVEVDTENPNTVIREVK